MEVKESYIMGKPSKFMELFVIGFFNIRLPFKDNCVVNHIAIWFTIESEHIVGRWLAKNFLALFIISSGVLE